MSFKPQRLVNDGRLNGMQCLQKRGLDAAVQLVQALGDQSFAEVVRYAQLLHLTITQMESREEWEYWLKKVGYTPAPTKTTGSAPVASVPFRDGDKAVIKWTNEGALVGNLTTRQNVTAQVAGMLGLSVRNGSLVADRMKLVELLATKFPIDGDIRQEQA